MKQTALLLGLHCHQPVDNFHHVVDEAIEKSYRPFFEVASQYPEFKFSVHYSGWLLEYIQEKDSKLFKLMQQCSRSGQIEFLSGGFYEPILASISSRDRIAQIKKLNNFIIENFGQEPKGLWLTERVWDSILIKDLANCGIEYVVVDDYHFISAGFDKDRLNGYFITEDEGVKLKIFPINKELRYSIPFEKVSKTINYLESISKKDISAGVIFDDGEKFGIWPQTYEWVYEKGWLEKFIQKSIKSKKVKPMLYKDYLEIAKPISLAYLPTASYIEMGEWSLEADSNLEIQKMHKFLKKKFHEESIEKFLKGSIWKNFLIKYYEANKIHKRVQELSNNQIDNENYLDSLYKAQTNDVLWHGVFGGTYLPSLRDNAYRFIIDCENIKHYEEEKTEILDINCDGFDEVKIMSKNLITIFDTKVGAQLVEFDIRDRSFNLQNTLTRYPESYHQKILTPSKKEKKSKKSDNEGISTIHDSTIINNKIYKKYLSYDKYFKNSFIDHVVNREFNLKSFKKSKFKTYGDNLYKEFEITECKDQKVTFKRGSFSKSFHIDKNCINFEISMDKQDKDRQYVLEHNLHFANLKDIKIDGKSFEKDREIKKSKSFTIEDSYTGKIVEFNFNKSVKVYICSLDTLSQSESGFDLMNQGLSIAIMRDLKSKLELSGSITVRD